MTTLKRRISAFIFITISTACIGVLCAAFRLNIPSAVLFVAAIFSGIILWYTLVQYSNLRLVVENEIIGISPAELSVKKNGGNIPLEKVIVSTFGVLVDSRVFLWGVGQTKLKEAVFSRETLSLRIATDRDEYHIKLLHGISDPAAISIIAEEIRYETGVTPTIEEWAHGKEESACSVNEK